MSVKVYIRDLHENSCPNPATQQPRDQGTKGPSIVLNPFKKKTKLSGPLAGLSYYTLPNSIIMQTVKGSF